METDKATAIREARAELRSRGELDSMNRVVAIVRCSKRTARKYWPETEPEPSAAAGAPVLEPVASAPPAPALDLTNIRAYYRSGGPAPWPPGAPWPDAGAPPLEAYPLLKELYRETDALVVKSWQAWMQTKNELGQVRGVPDETPVRQAEDRMSAQRLLQYRLKSDMDQVERNAEYRGVPLPT